MQWLSISEPLPQAKDWSSSSSSHQITPLSPIKTLRLLCWNSWKKLMGPASLWCMECVFVEPNTNTTANDEMSFPRVHFDLNLATEFASWKSQKTLCRCAEKSFLIWTFHLFLTLRTLTDYLNMETWLPKLKTVTFTRLSLSNSTWNSMTELLTAVLSICHEAITVAIFVSSKRMVLWPQLGLGNELCETCI